MKKKPQKSRVNLPQTYPRNEEGLGTMAMFPAPHSPMGEKTLDECIKAAFERTLTNKKGDQTKKIVTVESLVDECIKHLKERGDPILLPSILKECSPTEAFEIDAIAYEMQRHRMKIGKFYQYLLINLMKKRFPDTHDGKKEGDIEADIETPTFDKGLRLYISVKKSSDTVGGQDVAGVIDRLEQLGKREMDTLTRPYLTVICYATPPKGIIRSYEDSRSTKRNQDGQVYSPNCETWEPGFIYPYTCGLDPQAVYKRTLEHIGKYLPFETINKKRECTHLISAKLTEMGLVNDKTGKISPLKLQEFICRNHK